MTIAYISHPDCLQHDLGPYHPESPQRLSAIDDQLIASGLEMLLRPFDAPLATDEQLTRVHRPEYVADIRDHAPREGIRHLDGDTAMNPHSLAAALRAAGAGVKAVDLLQAGEAQEAFCAVRPPGHHAGPGRAAGFCIFNNIAVAAAHALEFHGLQRVAIVDFDVHHGDGTEEIFADDPRVLYCSVFQHPLYPYSGNDTQRKHIVNVPLAAGSGGEALRSAMQDKWLPALEKHQPQMLFISAGFDAHREDEMSGLGFVEDDYAWITRALKDVAESHCEGRIVSMLEGGYELHVLGRCVAAHINALLG